MATETTSWSGKPSLVSTILAGIVRGLLYVLLLSVSILPIIGVGLVALGQGQAAIPLVLAVSVFVVTAMVVVSLLQYAKAQYSVDSGGIEARVGVIKTADRAIAYDEIMSLQLERGTVDGVTGTGTLVVRTEENETSLRHIADPQQVLTMIEKQTGERD